MPWAVRLRCWLRRHRSFDPAAVARPCRHVPTTIWRIVRLHCREPLSERSPSARVFFYSTMDSIAATDRFLMLDQLAHSVRRAHELQWHIDCQRERIKILNRAGLNTYTAKLVLAQLEQSQALYFADCERLESTLSQLDLSGTRVRRECQVPSDDGSS